jgi:predicted RNA-binding Zn-ribbon protein involved in translation (DUF1610 family)
MKNRFEHITD